MLSRLPGLKKRAAAPVLSSATGSHSATEIIDRIISEAHAASASDVHLVPERDRLVARMRVDGLLYDTEELPLSIHEELLARLKVLASLRTDEHFNSQDGRFRFRTRSGLELDIRINILPTYHGENAVLRLLSASAAEHTLESLGFRSAHRAILARTLERTHGLILVTGPTGSGKTTTLYALLRLLAKRTRSIVTIEDPIEYSLPGMTQIPANPAHGLTFANALRSIVRQDPDVIMIGEIRDSETARLAVNAALTGHLVLSTLHTNDAAATLPRLLDMGIEPYLIASTVELVIAQRLVRRICTVCKEECMPDSGLLERLAEACFERFPVPTSAFRGTGCERCRGTGYSGRIGIYELLPVDRQVRSAVEKLIGADELRSIARKHGMTPMLLDGAIKARRGVTSFEEVLRTSHV